MKIDVAHFEFQFPSNGKAHLNLTRLCLCLKILKVSIPFKREGTSKPELLTSTFADMILFQFPSNGKAHLNQSIVNWKSLSSVRVSIPFKREGTSKHQKDQCDGGCGCHVSIPFKREGTSKHGNNKIELEKGKIVSIPFKREGTSKLTPFSTQMGRGSKHPKTKHELRRAFFL